MVSRNQYFRIIMCNNISKTSTPTNRKFVQSVIVLFKLQFQIIFRNPLVHVNNDRV